MLDALQHPILPPNSMLLERKIATLEECPDKDNEANWIKRQKYVTRYSLEKVEKRVPQSFTRTT